MRATQGVAAVVVREVHGQAVVDEDATLAGDDVDRVGGLMAAAAVEELQGDWPAAVEVDPMVLAIDPQGGLIGMHAGLGERNRSLPPNKTNTSMGIYYRQDRLVR